MKGGKAWSHFFAVSDSVVTPFEIGSDSFGIGSDSFEIGSGLVFGIGNRDGKGEEEKIET